MKEIEFTAYDMSNWVLNHFPIVPANEVPFIGKSLQDKDKDNDKKFVQCPGMVDYKNYGWIMPAWDDIHLYGSEMNSMIYYGAPNDVHGKRFKLDIENTDSKERVPLNNPCPFDVKAAGSMSADIIKGYAGKENYKPLHCTTPWAFSGDISLMILPAFYHSNISQIADVFPGIVDYSEKFNTINFILSVKKEGHSLIKAGTPLLHIIPIIKNNYTCNIDTSANLKNNRTLNVIPGNFKQYYRKLFMRKSKFKVNLNDY
jgi:hypothetical protein